MMNKFISVYNCAACGGEHRHLEFRPIQHVGKGGPIEGATAWNALCPIKGVRIYATNEQAKAGEMR